LSRAIALPDPFDLEGEKIILEEFETEDEALEWASEFLDIDEEGKISVLIELEELEEF